MKAIICCIPLISVVLGQSPDPFTGTWKLNTTKSTFLVNQDTYQSGVRTYAATKDGVRVTWTMVDAHGKKTAGEYTAKCEGGKCTSEVVRWTQKGARAVEGEMIANGTVTSTYTRTVSADGKTLKISFSDPQSKKSTSVQVWERQ